MRLGIRMLNSSSTLNNLIEMNQININPGETATIMFQLIDLDQSGCPARYMPGSTAQVSTLLSSLDISKTITKIATNPFPEDKSIWAYNLSAYETNYAAGVNMKVTLTEGTSVKIANAEAVVIFGPNSPYSC